MKNRIEEKKFVIVYQNKPIEIEVYSTGNSSVYLATFSDREPLFLTKRMGLDNNILWTSIPESKNPLADEIGRLIEIREKRAKLL